MIKPNYGIDAPRVILGLGVGSVVAGCLCLLSFTLEHKLWCLGAFLYTLFCAISLFITFCWMLYGTKIAKPRIVLKMIRNLQLKGHEKILDLGCGRGLLLCAIAKHLPHGKAWGIDLWSTKDQSGNSKDTTLQNARREGVANRIVVETGDVCSLPFSDNSFDAITSCLCLHNIKEKEQRKKALSEMLRVLQPKGKFAIADIQCTQEYASFLCTQGVKVIRSKPIYAYCPPLYILEGEKE